jgi:hypothetical protein
MRKLTLALDALRVESFATGTGDGRGGPVDVRGRSRELRRKLRSDLQPELRGHLRPLVQRHLPRRLV